MTTRRISSWLGMVALTALVAMTAGCLSRTQSSTTTPYAVSPLHDSRQLVLVVSRNWDATTATLQRYARNGAGQGWTPVGEAVPVNIGRTGLAWGLGLHHGTGLAGPVKREGDGKAPAGVFELPRAFGYASPQEAKGIKLPYLQLTPEVVGVDDVKSKYYNQLIRMDQVPAKDWDSAEAMRRTDGLYEWGVVVSHNTAATVPGAGSCIFLHIWRGPGKPTAGCTAMSKENMQKLLAWLDPHAKPVLVQLPQAAYRQLTAPCGLPQPD